MGGSQVGLRVQNEVLNRFIEFRANMAAAGDTLSPADVGEGSLIDFEDDNSWVSGPQSIAVQGDVGYFVDD